MRAGPLTQNNSHESIATERSTPTKHLAGQKVTVSEQGTQPTLPGVATTLATSGNAPSVALARFLVIGCGSQHRGDEAAGLQVVDTVESWQLNGVATLAVPQLTPDHASEIINADYVIFVEACNGQSCSRTVQIEPVVGDFQPLRLLSGKPQGLNPWTLLNLTEQRYGNAPQAWLLKVPAIRPTASEHTGGKYTEGSNSMSSTAQIGCDRAIMTISRFLQTYQKPAGLSA